jgi:hypothetical protein
MYLDTDEGNLLELCDMLDTLFHFLKEKRKKNLLMPEMPLKLSHRYRLFHLLWEEIELLGQDLFAVNP